MNSYTKLDKIDFSKLEKVGPIIDHLPVAVAVIDVEGHFRLSNRIHNEMHDFDSAYLIGKKFFEVLYPDPSQKTAIEEYFHSIVKDQPTPTPYFAFNVGKDGIEVPIRTDWNYIYDQGKLVGIASIVYDLRVDKEKLSEVDVKELDEICRDVYLKLRTDSYDEDLNLSSREREVLDLLCQGYENSDISEILGISIRTIDKHRENILKKTSHTSITQLIVKILRGDR